jgi:type II secretory ATPase GspE/PulE/Tfp pilus assembly ATPase PilB-like protein
VSSTCGQSVPRADFSCVDPAAVALLAERWARRYGVLPLREEHGMLVVATSDVLDLDAERAIGFATGRRVRWVEAPQEEIEAQLARWYADGHRTELSAPPVEVRHIGFSAGNSANAPADDAASALPLVDQLLAEGIQAGASDIHVEPEEEGIAVRHRIDGVLRQVRLLPKSLGPSLASRVKILSGLDIADRMRPQDGRARVAVRGAGVDQRV